MRSLTIVFCMAVVCLAVPIAASGQGIEAKLGDDTTATFVVKDGNGQEILVLEAKDQGTESPNVIVGHDNNEVTAGAYGATIAGGGTTTYRNKVTDSFGTVGGGRGNLAGNNAGTTADASYATVGGGGFNWASGSDATVGGGGYNRATGARATVPGGYDNYATGDYSFAAGRSANANNQGCFVWGDSTNADITCSTDNRWVARTTGGVDFFSSSGLTTGVALAAGGNSWTGVSDRAVKENFSPVDKREILEKVAAMPIEEWNLKSQDPSIRHIGPVAQDFNTAFGFEESERHINMMDATGVTMAAVQGLYGVVRNQEKTIESQATQIHARDHRIEDLEAKARRIDDMERRLAELTRLVSGSGTPE